MRRQLPGIYNIMQWRCAVLQYTSIFDITEKFKFRMEIVQIFLLSAGDPLLRFSRSSPSLVRCMNTYIYDNQFWTSFRPPRTTNQNMYDMRFGLLELLYNVYHVAYPVIYGTSRVVKSVHNEPCLAKYFSQSVQLVNSKSAACLLTKIIWGGNFLVYTI